MDNKFWWYTSIEDLKREKYPSVVIDLTKVNTSVDELNNWCKQQGMLHWKWERIGYGAPFRYWFQNHEDAVLFELTWL